LRFSVADTGIGIDPELKDHLFEPFAQADGSTTRQFGGTGLGLAISRRLANGLGGSLDFASIPGEGTTFTVEVPARSAADRVEQPDRVDAPAADLSEPLRILVAEDNILNQQVIRGLLETDHALTFCANGEEALELATTETFDLILMDVHMPKMDGVAATTAIKKKGVSAPVVALTADADVGKPTSLAAGPFDGVVVKPYKVRALFEEISRVLSARHACAAVGRREAG
jgi:CheY-like chemotaxis protein